MTGYKWHSVTLQSAGNIPRMNQSMKGVLVGISTVKRGARPGYTRVQKSPMQSGRRISPSHFMGYWIFVPGLAGF